MSADTVRDGMLTLGRNVNGDRQDRKGREEWEEEKKLQLYKIEVSEDRAKMREQSV